MNQQPDKLFRDKLQSFQTPAPSGAWNRIEANLDKKNDKVLWFRIAASLLLVAIAAYLLWPSNSINTPKPELAGKTKTQETVKPEQKKEEQIIPVAPSEEKKIAKQQTKSVERVVKDEQQNSQQQKQKPVVADDDDINLSENNITSVDHNNKEHMPEIISTPVETQTTVVASAETQKLKIIFSADEVDNKYLDKKALAEATSDDKKPSTLKKLLDKAYDLKYNQDPFGDLRQKKNEILALNFRKDKRSEN
jgi:hypothetical protein